MSNCSLNRHRLVFVLPIILGIFTATALSQSRGPTGLPGTRTGTSTPRGENATFFVGRLRFGSNWVRECSSVGKDLVRLVAEVSTLQVQEERTISVDDPALFEAPFVFMNGHGDFVLSESEVNRLREYFARGGFVMASGCCTYAAFPLAWRREFSRVFSAQQVNRLPYAHSIYRSFSRIDRIRCLHEPRDIYLEGMFYRNRLVAVMCPDGLCCAFSMNNECNRRRGVKPEDGKKLALNIAVYALTH